MPNGGTITFSYATPAATVSSTNWIGIYTAGQTPGQVGSTTYQYAPGASGSLTFSATSLSGVGSYTAFYLYNDGYQVLAGPATFSVVPSAPAPAPTFARAISLGSTAQPFGVAVAAGNQIWVADRAGNRLTEFTPSGALIRSVGEHGPGGLEQPSGVAIDGSGNVWAVDTGHNRIVKYSPKGDVLTAFGSAGAGSGQLNRPQGLAIGPSGHVYVADQGNNRIEVFTPAGGYVSAIPVPTPDGAAFDATGHLWVSSPSYANGNAVFEFAPDGSQLHQFNSTQSEYGALSNPGGIAVGPDGRIYVAQPDYGWVTVLNTDGSFYTEFGLQAGSGSARADLEFPQALAFAPDGHIWLADSGNGRVAEFAPASPAHAAAAVAAPAGRPRTGWPAAGVVALFGLAAAAALAIRYRRRRAGGTAAPAGPPPPGAAVLPAITAAPAPATGLAMTRRSLLTGATALTGTGLGAAVLPVNLRKALAASLATPPRARLTDIKNIVILMQENRSFDHYFGTMPGVRGFGDPAAIKLPNGNPVFYQPDPSHPQGYLTPFHYDTSKTSAQATPGTDHSWETQHQAWNGGAMDSWIPAKGPYTMGYFTSDDIPFHWALAEAFTICDNYHCSVLGPTNPNRLHMWTGWIDPDGTAGGPVIDNTPAFNNVTLSWTTYPERLQQAGISWQVYQEEDNYDDNSLAWFTQFGNAAPGSALQERGMRKRPAGAFEDDARRDRLPQVSWLVAPTAQTEHPDYFPAAGAEYIAQKLDAIASNPDVWAKTAFILCYDENDGIFDHVVPPTPPAGTPGEFVQGEPVGLGFRVPAIVVSPWTAGGHVYSGVLDHTSLIRFIEARFGVAEPHISAWRRQACGDFTGAFRFSGTPARYPNGNSRLRLAAAAAELLTAQAEVNDNPAPTIPAVNEPIPSQ